MKTPFCSRLSAFVVASVALSCAAAPSCAAPSKAETEVVKTLDAKADAAEAIAKGAAAGIVLGPDSKPITGATVAFYKSGRWQETAAQTVTTDAAGRFSVTIAAPASKAASAATEPVGRVVVVAPDLALGGGALKKSGGVFRLQAGHAVSGRVADESGKPVAGARVRLRGIAWRDTSDPVGSYVQLQDAGAFEEKFVAKTAADGRWTMNGLPPTGSAYFELDDPNYAREGASLELTIAFDAPVLVARAGGKISGRVLLPGNKPLAGVRVAAQSEESEGSGRGDAVTNKDGRYLLTGLKAGSYNVSISETSGEWVANEISSLNVEAGKTASAPGMVLIHGILVSGMVVDAASGEPLAGAQIGAQGPHGFSSSPSTGDDGRYQVRVAAGVNRFYLYAMPLGYLKDYGRGDNEITVAPGQAPLAPFKLEKGITLRGTALDENGRPATGALLIAGETWNGTQATVDENGNWAMFGARPDQFIGGFLRGEIEREISLTVAGAWQIVGPEKVKLPAPDEIKVVLRRITLATLRGRAVTTDGAPIEGAALQVKASAEKARNSWPTSAASSAKDGTFSVAELRPENTVSVSVKKRGFKFVSGGEVSLRGKDFAVADLVMAPLSATLAGRVLDAAGAPAANAEVVSLDEGEPQSNASPIVVADARGHFVISGLAAGATRVMAARGSSFGEVQGKATTGASGKDEATIMLRNETPPPTYNVERAVAILDSLRKSDDAKERKIAQALAPYLAAHDPDRALLFAAADKTISDADIIEIVTRLAKADPKRAAQWAPSQFSRLRDMSTQVRTALDLGVAIASVDAKTANLMLAQARDYLKLQDASRIDAAILCQMAALSARLNRPEAQTLLDRALSMLKHANSDAKQRAERMPAFAEIVAAGGADLLRRFLRDLAPSDRVEALQRAIPVVARFNAGDARALLKEMAATVKIVAGANASPSPQDQTGGSYHSTSDDSYSLAAFAVVRALAPIDPEGALAVARTVKNSSYVGYDRANMLALLASAQKPEAAAPVLREAMDVADSLFRATDTMARLAALAQRSDSKLGDEFFKRVKAKLFRLSPYPDNSIRASFAPYAYYRAAIDPAESRLLLESEWARRDKNSEDDNYGQSSAAPQIARAMAAVDVDRAVVMARSLSDKHGGKTGALARIIVYVLASDAERRVMPFGENGQWE